MKKTTDIHGIKITDVFGEYEPTLNKCGCIDKRTLINIGHSLRILYAKENKELTELKKEKNPRRGFIDTSDLVIKRTESLLDAINSIESCEDGPFYPDSKKICVCKRPMENVERLTGEILENIETYKDITIGGADIYSGGMKKITQIDIIERMEDVAKKILLQKNEYERCCFPSGEIPKISKEMINVKSPMETMGIIKKMVEEDITKEDISLVRKK